MERKLTKAYRKAYQDNLIKRVKRQAIVESSNDTTTEDVELLTSEEDPITSVKNHTAPDEFSANNSSEVNLPSIISSRNMSSSFDSDNRVDDEVESIFASLDPQNLFNGSVQSERLTSHEPKVLIHNIISGLPRPEIEMLYTVYQGKKKSCSAKEI